MSAPQTNLDKQRKRHMGPLIGMGLAVIVGVLLIVYWLFDEAATSDPAEQPQAVERLAPTTEAPLVMTPDAPGGVPGSTMAPPQPQSTD